MQKIDEFAHTAKIVAQCLPPMVMSLLELAALSCKKGCTAPFGGTPPAPVQGPRGAAQSNDV